MSLLSDIKEDLNKVRKARDKAGITLLTILYDEAAMKGKNNGNRESTDEEVIATIRKFVKNVKEILEHTASAVARENLELEITVYEYYLPTQLTA